MNKCEKLFELAKNYNKATKLCERGFLITTLCSNEVEKSAFYLSNWKKDSIEKFNFYIHQKQKFYKKSFEKKSYFLIGHAYNPFNGVIDEEKILEQLYECNDETMEIEYINSLTGVFMLGKIEKEQIVVLLDCAGMLSGFYGVIKDHIVITSHTVLSKQLFDLNVSDYINSLINYRFYHLYGSFLPGDLTPYDEMKRIVPNTMISISLLDYKINVKRFFPYEPLQMCETEEDYNKKINEICDLMKKTLSAIAKKWKKPAISLTGGMDSKTTLAAAKDTYASFQYFSYITSKAEKIDAEAARKICSNLRLKHKTYNIERNPNEYKEYDVTKEILQYNKDYIGKNNVNDICKRIYFDNKCDFDVEVKSWVSEIARANYYKKFGKRRMPKVITPRRCSTLYKIFLHNRSLLKKTDSVFEEYMVKTELINHLYNYDWSDMFLWEIRYGSWGGLVITSEHKYSFDITIPYNNRKLLMLMLSVPLEKRRKDILHEDLIKCMNLNIHDTGITIVNMNETKFREIVEKIYFDVNSILPF